MGLRDLVRRGKRPLLVAAKDVTVLPEDNDKVAPTSGQAEGNGGSSSGLNPVDTASLGLDDAKSTSKEAGLAPATLAWDNVWAEAYETLRSDPEYAKLLAAFEKYIMADKGVAVDAAKKTSLESEGPEKLKQIQGLAEEKLRKLPEARLSFSIGDKEIVVRDVVKKTISVVTAFKGVISSAISTEPAAGLAWAGIMSILPLVGNSLQQDDDAESGLKNIVFLLVRYQRLQDEVLAPECQRSSLSEKAFRVFSEIRTKLVRVYAQIYVYEIRFVLQYARGRAHRASRNAVAADDWKSIWADIESTSQMIDQGVREHVGARTLEAVKDIIARAEKIENLQQATLESVKAGNQTQLILTLPCATNAIFDSTEIIGKEGPCLRGTRRDVLNRIQDWAENPTGEVIFWLHGMAGTGKTSVALSVATALNTRQPFTEGRQPPRSVFLGASFFFKQGDTTRNGTKIFFPTLARRLAQGFPDLGAQIADAVRKNLEIGTKAPQQQLERLVFKPLSVVDKRTFVPVRLVVVVDALDECIEQKEVDDLVGMLRALEELHQVQLRVLITSRRDDHIIRSFEKLPIDMYRPSLLDKVRSPDQEDQKVDDITKYLVHTLAKIAAERDVPASWIDEDGIASLSKKADGLFIYAATMCRFLDCEDFDDEEAREDRLEQILGDEVDTDAPQQKVDEIYLKVLSFPHLAKLTRKSQAKFHERTKMILGFITAFFEPVSVSSLSALLSIDKEELNKTLRKFHSVLDIPQDEHAPLGLIHLSFRDFLLSEERSSKLPFQVEEISMHQAVFEACLSLMSRELHQDMCELVLPGHLTSDVTQGQLERGIPRYLQYAVLYWVSHLEKLSGDQRKEVGMADGKAVYLFLSEKLLFWLEAMSLIRETSAAIVILNKLGTMVDSAEDPILSGLVYDARRFVLNNKTAIERAPLQLYSSALIFSPSKCKVCSLFRHLIPSWITQVPELEEDWTSNLYALEENDGGVVSVAFSPVDDLLVSGCLRDTAIIWDYVTATKLYSFLEPDIVLSVAFSPDGKTVACGLRNGMIRIREFAKGKSIDLIGHTNPVYSVAFSPKSSSTLASVSADKTLRVWNIEKERAAHILDISLQYAPLVRKGPSLDVEFPPGGLAFSPRGDFVAVGSNAGSQGSVTLWGVEKGELRTTFVGHDSFVPSVAISTDGETVISGSADHTVKVWNAKTGQTRHETRYAASIENIRFCPPNGEHVIITHSIVVEIRRADTWDLVGNFNGGFYADLALSRDGHFLATASMGSNILLRDMRDITRKFSSDVRRKGTSFIQFFPGEDDDVMTVSDYVVRFWDANNALIKSTPGHLRQLSFSADGRFIGLEMYTATVQVWSQGMARKIASYDDTYGMKFSPASSHVAIRSLQKTRIIDLTTLEETAVLDSDLKLGYPIAFSLDGRVLAWINNSERICFLDLAAGEELVGPPCVSVDYITFSPDSALVALSGDDRERVKLRRSVRKNRDISLLEVATGKERVVFAAAYWELVTFHPAGHLMAAGESGISVWNTASGDVIRTFKLDAFIPGEIGALAISIAGDLVAAVGTTRDSRGAIQLWDFATGTATGILHISTSIRDLAFSSDCRYLETRRGRVPLPPPVIGQAAALDDASLETAESCLYVLKEWVAQGFDDLLWIPQNFRHIYPAVKGHTIAFGRWGGKVTYLRFDLAKTPLSTRAKGFRQPK